MERAKGTGYSLHDLAGKVNLVFLSGAHSVLLRDGAVITGGSNSTGFPRADLVNAKFTSKGNILSACQWLKAIWLSLAVCFPKIRKGTALGPAATTFHRHSGGPCSGLQRVWGEKADIRGYADPGTEKILGQDLNFLRTRQGPKTTGNKKILSMATEVCRTHAQQKHLSNAYSRTTCRCLPVGSHPFL